MEENLPPGFRFHPTDEELITYYLTQKVSDLSFVSKAVAVVDLNKCEPWDLPDKASMGEKEWYFYSLKDRKYPTGLRTNRATEAGYWKTTGKDKEILIRGGSVVVGMKKTLVFYKGRAPRGEKSNWVMHEYRLENKHPLKNLKEEWVVCRVFQKSTATKRPQNATSSREPSVESPCETNSIANEFAEIAHNNNNNNQNGIANLSPGFEGLLANNLTNMMSMNNNNMNNWANSLPSLSSWPSNFLNPNLSVNSLLLKALQLRTNNNTASYNQPREDNNYNNSYSNLSHHQGISQFGTDHISNTSNANFQLLASSSSSSLPASDNKMNNNNNNNNTAQLEQPFNLDSMNW